MEQYHGVALWSAFMFGFTCANAANPNIWTLMTFLIASVLAAVAFSIRRADEKSKFEAAERHRRWGDRSVVEVPWPDRIRVSIASPNEADWQRILKISGEGSHWRFSLPIYEASAQELRTCSVRYDPNIGRVVVLWPCQDAKSTQLYTEMTLVGFRRRLVQACAESDVSVEGMQDFYPRLEPTPLKIVEKYYETVSSEGNPREREICRVPQEMIVAPTLTNPHGCPAVISYQNEKRKQRYIKVNAVGYMQELALATLYATARPPVSY